LLLGMEDEAGKAEASVAPAAEAVPASSRVPSRREQRRDQPRWPSDLEVLEEVIEPEEVKAEPQAWRCIGAEVSDQLDYEPARFLVRRQIRRKFVHRTEEDATPVIAELPPKLQERCLAAPGLLAQIIVSKYCDHIPLYRQEQIYATRHRVILSRQIQAQWLGMAACNLKPIYQAVRTDVLAQGYMQVDETPVEYLSPGHGKTKLGYLWTYHCPGGDTVFDWQTSRAATCLDKVIPVDFRGTLQTDGYSAYGAFARERGEAITLAGCWAHARRGFYEALESAPRDAALIVHQLRNLYAIEARLRESRAGPKLRAIVRALESRPIVDRLEKTLRRWRAQNRHLPQSAMGQAIDYILGQWQALQIYLEDGRVEIDNNLVENAIRPTAIGKKNWLFIGDAGAGERGAILYTLVESCRRRGLDSYRYLREVLTALPTMTNWQIKDWTPEAWARRQRTQRKAA
jgi:transposase